MLESKAPPMEQGPAGVDAQRGPVASDDLEETDESVSEPLSGVALAGALYGRIQVQDNATRLLHTLLLADFCRDMDQAHHVE